MKISKPALFGSMLFILASCSKTDLQQSTPTQNTASISSKSSQVSSWKSISNWSGSQQQNLKQFSGTLLDSAITSDIVQKGLVLVYSKNGATVQSLPFNSSNQSWFYHISAGSVKIEAIGDVSNLIQGQNFRYIILNNEQLNKLASQGKTKIDLMNLSHDSLLNLLSSL